MPRLNGSSSTLAPAARATSAVASVDPSLTTSTSQNGARSKTERITDATVAASLYAGMRARCAFFMARARRQRRLMLPEVAALRVTAPDNGGDAGAPRAGDQQPPPGARRCGS